MECVCCLIVVLFGHGLSQHSSLLSPPLPNPLQSRFEHQYILCSTPLQTHTHTHRFNHESKLAYVGVEFQLF